MKLERFVKGKGIEQQGGFSQSHSSGSYPSKIASPQMKKQEKKERKEKLRQVAWQCIWCNLFFQKGVIHGYCLESYNPKENY